MIAYEQQKYDERRDQLRREFGVGVSRGE